VGEEPMGISGECSFLLPSEEGENYYGNKTIVNHNKLTALEISICFLMTLILKKYLWKGYQTFI
jgi:hypothetical protein